MPGTPFTTNVRRSGDRVVVDLHGDVNRSSQADLEQAYEQAAAFSEQLVLNFAGVDYINSTGIAVIVGLLAKARAEHRRIAAYGLSDHYREIFQITRLSDFMTIHKTETAALAAG